MLVTVNSSEEIDALVDEGVAQLDHEYAVYVRLRADSSWPREALARVLADLRTAHPRVESVDVPEHDVVLSVDGDGLDARGAAEQAVERVSAAVHARGLSGHAVDVTVISDSAVWAYDEDEFAGA